MAQVLSVICNERGGECTRLVVEMPRDIRLWQDILRQMQTVPNFLAKSDYENTRAFLDERNQFYLIDDVGIAAVFPQRWFQAAHVHITFWDRKLRGRENLCRLLCDYVKTKYELDHLFTVIPVDSKTVLAFAKRIGFQDKSADRDFSYLIY